MTYYLQDHPNPNTPQYGWERAKLGQPGTKLSGVVGVHTSEAITDFEGVDNNAENNAAFLGRRTDYGSYHTTGDADSILPLVHPRYAAWADTTNNAHAMSVSGCVQAARWLEMTPVRRRAVVVNMAVAAARMVLTAVADGYLAAPTPAVRISAAEAVSGSRPGFYGHGETNPGTRYDPGQNFDWDLFLATYANAIGITYQGSTTPEEEFLMALTAQQQEDLHHAIVTDEGRQAHAQKFADVLLRTTLAMRDGGTPTVEYLLAVLNERIGLLPGLNADLRGEADIERAYRAVLLAAVTALSGGQANVSTEQVVAAIDAAMEKFASSYELTLTKAE